MTSICATASVGQPSVGQTMQKEAAWVCCETYLCAETRRDTLHEGGGVGEEFWRGAFGDPGACEELHVSDWGGRGRMVRGGGGVHGVEDVRDVHCCGLSGRGMKRRRRVGIREGEEVRILAKSLTFMWSIYRCLCCLEPPQNFPLFA